MPIITKSIGTNARDYSTISAWEADLANGAVYSSGDEAVGECYNDSVFDESFNIDDTGPAFGLSSITLKANSSDRHDGTEGSGVKVTYTGSVSSSLAIFLVSYNKETYGADIVKIEDIEFGDITVSTDVIFYGFNLGLGSCIMSRCLIYDLTFGGPGNQIFNVFGPDAQNGVTLQNTIIYNCGKTATGSSTNGKMTCFNSHSSAEHYNVTVYNIYDDTPTAASWGAFNGIYKNCIIVTAGQTFRQETGSSSDYNLSYDSHAPGSNSIKNVNLSRVFVSKSAGSIDLHLKNLSPALRKGLNIGTSNDVQKDIDGEDRDTSGATNWDIGADQCGSCTPDKEEEFSSRMGLDGDMGSFSMTKR